MGRERRKSTALPKIRPGSKPSSDTAVDIIDCCSIDCSIDCSFNNVMHCLFVQRKTVVVDRCHHYDLCNGAPSMSIGKTVGPFTTGDFYQFLEGNVYHYTKNLLC